MWVFFQLLLKLRVTVPQVTDLIGALVEAKTLLSEDYCVTIYKKALCVG